MIHWFLEGGPVMWPLLVCSVIAVAVIFERARFWVAARRRRDPAAIHRLLHLVERGLFENAKVQAQSSQDPAARVLAYGLSHHHFSLEGALEVAANAEYKQMKRYLGALDTIITVAPLLGIFGTITGILVAFSALEGRIPDPQVVAAGIAQAVITTVAGLAIAIPAVVAYNFFVAKVEEAAGELSAHVTQCQIVYEKGRRRVPSDLAAVETSGQAPQGW